MSLALEKLISLLESKLKRQRDALVLTEEHLAAARALQKAAPSAPQSGSGGNPR